MPAATQDQAEGIKDAIAVAIVAISIVINELDRWITDPRNVDDRPQVEPEIQDLTGQFHALESRLAALERGTRPLAAPAAGAVSTITSLSDQVANETLASKQLTAAMALVSSAIDLGMKANSVGRA